MTFRVELTAQARSDLKRLFDFLLDRDGARDGGDPEQAPRAIDAIVKSFGILEWAPFTCRKAGDNPFLRELVIPFGSTGHVALFEVVDTGLVMINAIRPQLEDDYFT